MTRRPGPSPALNGIVKVHDGCVAIMAPFTDSACILLNGQGVIAFACFVLNQIFMVAMGMDQQVEQFYYWNR
ncbi:hypothetical protein [Komagataeibacter xylinus]|uniref:hypothetical protein n=1 Tax=Komagataeibacter xylinus TaxID=28448 RepID=UPI00280B98F8|nr:hypothetical protein [Komagataeibacter xylinus]